MVIMTLLFSTNKITISTVMWLRAPNRILLTECRLIISFIPYTYNYEVFKLPSWADREGATGGMDPHLENNRWSYVFLGWIERERQDVWTSPPPPPGKSQVVIRFLRTACTDPLREAIGPVGSRRRSIWHSVVYTLLTTKTFLRTPPLRSFLDPRMLSIQN